MLKYYEGGIHLEDNNFKYYQEKVSKSNKTFKSIDKKPNSFSKAVHENVNLFGNNQNEFNTNVSMALEESGIMLEELNSKLTTLETKMASILQQNESLKSRINALQRTDLMIVDSCLKSSSDNTKLINDYIRRIRPDVRNSSAPTGCKEVDHQTLMESIRMPKDGNYDSFDINAIGKSYRDTLKKELQKVALDGASMIVSVICTGFLNPAGLSDDTYQAVQIYKLLKKSSVYRAKFISIESSLEHPVLNDDFLCIPAKNCGQYLKVIDAKLNIFCVDTLDFFNLDNRSMLAYKGFIVLTGQNPVDNVSNDLIEQLCYANDFGLHNYAVQSNATRDLLVENGFHRPTILYPIIDRDRFSVITKDRMNHEKITIGIVSTINPNDDNGLSLLIDVVKRRSNDTFKILWNATINVPDGLSKAENCIIIKNDNERFYSDIDCLLIPYVNTNNGACPESGLEAMLLKIPVICTDVCGLSELIKSNRLGEVVKPTVEDICKALDSIVSNRDRYINLNGYHKLENTLDYSNLIDTIEQKAELNYPEGYISLEDWKNTLKKVNKTLIKGEQSVIDYYDKMSEVSPITDSVSRVLRYLELQSLNAILEDRYDNNRKLTLLDISCKNESITNVCNSFGKCTTLDSFILSDMEGSYNAVVCFDYWYHFDYLSRKVIYKKADNCLKQNGILIINVPNLYYETIVKSTKGWNNYDIYSMAWTKESIVKELKENGFKAQYIIPVGQGLNSNVPDNAKRIPMTWTIGAIKR